MRLPRLPLLDGPKPGLPRPLDALVDAWAGLRPRVRLLVLALALVATGAAAHARLGQLEARWGGTPVAVLVATEDLPAGSAPAGLRTVRLPPAIVPPTALADIPDGQVLTAPLPQHAVLTSGHLHPRGPAAVLGPERRAVPIPVEEGWGVVAGGWVDLWVLGAEGQQASQIASGRAVLEVTGDAHEATALVELHADEVGPATAGLARGQLLLAHAPAGGREDGRR
jgi:hypothetical protein